MSSILKRVKKDATLVVQDNDSLGRTIFESNVYPYEIEKAYVFVGKTGSTGVTFEGKLEDKPYSFTQYITNKKGDNYYNSNGRKGIMQGYIMVDSILRLACEKSLEELDEIEFEEKVIKIGNENRKVDYIVDLEGTSVLLGLIKQKKNKQVIAEDKSGYVDTNEAVFVNEIAKVFCSHQDYYGMTSNELASEAEEAKLMPDWIKKYKDTVQDKFTPVTEAPAKAAPKTGLASRGAVNRAKTTPVSTDDEGNDVDTDTSTDDVTEAGEEEAPVKQVRKSFTRRS